MAPDFTQVDSLCRTYGYPDAVRALLREVTAAVQVERGSLGGAVRRRFFDFVVQYHRGLRSEQSYDRDVINSDV